MLDFDSPSASQVSPLTTPTTSGVSLPTSASVPVLIKPNKAKSWVWEHFSIYHPKHHPEKKGTANCNICIAQVKHGDNTDKLIRHIRTEHKEIYKEFLSKKASTDLENNYITNWMKPTNRNTVLNAFLKWTIMTYQPLNTCTDPYFREFCAALNNKAEIFGRGRITDELEKLSERVRVILKTKLKGEDVAITTDHWTSIGNESYLAITAHWISSDWNLHCTTLCCTHHPLVSETALEIARVVREGWEAFDIDADSIVAIVSDTAANMNAAGILFNSPHHYCVAHVLELTRGFAFEDENVPGAENTMG